MIVASVVLVLLLFGGRKWWDSVDSEYRNNRLYKPEPIAASLRAQDGKRILALERLDNRRQVGREAEPLRGFMEFNGHLFYPLEIRPAALLAGERTAAAVRLFAAAQALAQSLGIPVGEVIYQRMIAVYTGAE